MPLPEEKLQQYTPLVPGKVLYICRWAAPHNHTSATLLYGVLVTWAPLCHGQHVALCT